ncbi:hypothetical protein [Herbiconiux sp. YIM B11900]|uniref:hypothetical protein n=1 Tax=Herbiconiux sp. YIM B11900 TaxID=3404131 RepID=UPI003F83AD96
MSNAFVGPALPLTTGIPRGFATYAPAGETITGRHAVGYDAFVELVGVERARSMSADGALVEIVSRARAIRESPDDLERSAVIFLGNKITQELPNAEWRAYGTSGLEISTGTAAYNVAGAVRSACEDPKDPREGLRRFFALARGGEPKS